MVETGYTRLLKGSGAVIYSGFLLATSAAVLLFPQARLPFFSLLAYALWALDFIIHEAGHFLLAPLGTVPGVLGGTLHQFFVPAVLVLSAVCRKMYWAASFFGLWFGQSLLHAGRYIADARSQALPRFAPVMLVGGSETIHDWHFLLEKAGLLWASQGLGYLVYILGMTVMLLSALSPLAGFAFGQYAARQKRAVRRR